MTNYPVFELKINEDVNDESGVDFIALVDEPAIMKQWHMFNEQKQKIQFHSNNDKRIITSPVLVPDMPVIRYDLLSQPYFLVIRKPEIQKVIKKFFKLHNVSNINEMHTPTLVKGSYVIESWLVSSQSDKSKTLGMDLPEGTWMVSIYFEDEKYWNENVKTGKYKGLSMEGYFEHVESEFYKNILREK
jgi:hypothetical protein